MAWRLNAAADEAKLKQVTIAERLGEKPATVGNWFQGLNWPRSRAKRELAALLGVSHDWLFNGDGEKTTAAVVEPPDAYTAKTAILFPREVGVVSWSHAGQAASYDEIPKDWREKIATTSRDRRAFGVVVEGDCMEPKYLQGDILIIEPSSEPRNGKPVVAKLKDDAVQVRIYTKMPGSKIRLATMKPDIYPTLDHSPADFHWIWPVHSMVRKE
jgi:phage repressor protein C with HTH and peptisase S24 domain